MKSAVETLNPTRVRLTVEVPSEELKPSLDAAYKKISQSVTVPGFRKGKIPQRIIDQRFGREAVFVEAFDDILSSSYGKAVEENELRVLGQPEVTEVTEVGELSGGADLKFVAEVDTRPTIEVPDYDGIEVEVEDLAVGDDDIAGQIDQLRDRFGSLKVVERAAEKDDTVVLDLEAKVDGEVLEDGVASGLSYVVGSGTMLDGLDEAVTGLSAGEDKTFTSELKAGEGEAQEAEVKVTVTSVKVKELPELDDDFAQLASEFDTLEELRADIKGRLEHTKAHDQINDGRDKVLDKLLELVDVPLPEKVVGEEIEQRKQQMDQQLAMMGVTLDKWLEIQGQTAEAYDSELEESVRKGMRVQFLLDEVVKKEQIAVNQEELTQHLVARAQQSGMSPDQFAQQVMQAGYVPVLVGEVARGKALDVIAGAAKATDASGNAVDLGKDLHADDEGHEGHDH